MFLCAAWHSDKFYKFGAQLSFSSFAQPSLNNFYSDLFQTALLSRYRPPDEDHGVFQMMALSVICLIFLLVCIVFVIRTIGKIAFGFNRAHFRYTTTVSGEEGAAG